MDEKTEELRDIFMDVTDEDTVTETQEEERGSLTEDEGKEAERLENVVRDMREAYDFSTDLSDRELVRVVRGFYEGAGDTAIADDLDVSRKVVFRARIDLHLIRDRDTDAPFDLQELRASLVEDAPVAEVADHFGVSESTVRRYRRVVEAQTEARRVSERYRSEFEDALVDLSASMTEDVKEDGLDDATDGMETDVSF